MNKGEKEPTTETSVIKELFSTLLYIAFALVLAFLIVRYVGQRTQVDGNSMNATLYDKDNLLIDKISYRFRDPERFDIVVFPYPQDEKEYYIKRIIGLPGESVRIQDGVIYINGSPLEENYGNAVMEDSGRAIQEIQLAEDEYFVLGDNRKRNKSNDSRFEDVGNIKRSKIIGRAFIRIWPLDRFGLLKHK